MSQNAPLLLKVLASSVCAADRAGNIIRQTMSGGNLGIVEKGKNDLQTEADRAAQRCIISSLSKLYPKISIIGEEGALENETSSEDLVADLDPSVLALQCPPNLSTVKDEEICVWVDPLDGTSEYTQGLLDHVTVLIGVAVGKEAVGGVIHQPYYNYKSGGEMGRTIWALRGCGVNGIARHPPPPGRIITTTRSHSSGLVEQVIQTIQPTDVLRVGGAGHKVMLLIEGKANAYVFASAGCKRWDTCAPEAILRELGGELTDMHGNYYDYSYRTPHVNVGGVLATFDKNDHSSYVEKIAPIVEGKL